MAEQQRLQSQNFRTSVPRVDFVAQQVEARGLSQLSSSLDRLSNFFMQQAEQKARIEGAEYGALNAPTRQQLEDAKATGKDIELVGDKTTVFGRAARQVALETASEEMTYLAKRDISGIVLNAQDSNVEPAAVADAIDTVIAGYGSALDETEPTLARSFRAKVGIYGNAEYETYTKQFLTDAKAQRKSQFATGVEFILKGLPKYFSAGNPEDGSEAPFDAAKTLELIQMEKATLLNQAANKLFYNRAEIEQLANQFDAAVQDAAKGQLLSAIIEADEPYRAFLEIEANSKNLDPGTRAALEALTPENRKTAIQDARQAWLNTISDENTQIERNNRIRDRAIKNLEQRLNLALFLAVDNPDQAKNSFLNAVKEMASLDADKARQYRDMLPSDGKGFYFAPFTNNKTKLLLESRMQDLDNQLTLTDLDTFLMSGDLSFADWKSYSETVRTRMSDRFTEAVKDIRLRLQLPTAQFNTGLVSAWKINTMNKVERAMREARRNSTNQRDFDPMAWLDENYDAIAGQEKDDGNKADLAALAPFTRVTLEQKINISQGNPTDQQYYQGLMDTADRLISEGVTVPGF